MEITDNLIELINQINLDNLPIENSNINFTPCLPVIINQFPSICKAPKQITNNKYDRNESQMKGWDLNHSIYAFNYQLNTMEFDDLLNQSEIAIKQEVLSTLWENLMNIESFVKDHQYTSIIRSIIDLVNLIPNGMPSCIIDQNPSTLQYLERLNTIFNSSENSQLFGFLISSIYLNLNMVSSKFTLDHIITVLNLTQANSTIVTLFLCNIMSEWEHFIKILVKYGIDSGFNPQLTQYAVKVLLNCLKLQPHRKMEFLRLIRNTPFMADEVLRLNHDTLNQQADFWNGLFIDAQSLIHSINLSSNIPSNPPGWKLSFWENLAPTPSGNSSINLMKIDSLMRCTLAYQKHVGGLFTEPFNVHTKVLANVYKALASSPYPERTYCSTLAFLLVNLNYRFPQQIQFVKHLLEKFWQIFPYGIAYLLGMIFRLPDSFDQLQQDLNSWTGVEYPLNAIDTTQLNMIKEYFSSEGIYPKKAKDILLNLPYPNTIQRREKISPFGALTDYSLESMILLFVNCKEWLNCDQWVLNMITSIKKHPIPPHCFRLLDVYIQRTGNKLSPKIPEMNLKHHLSDCLPHKTILPKHILLSYYYIKYHYCLVPDLSNINPNISDLSYSHQILDKIPLLEIEQLFESQARQGLETYFLNFKGLLVQFFKYLIYSQNLFNRNFELNSYRHAIGNYPNGSEVFIRSNPTHPILMIQELMKNTETTLTLYNFLLNTNDTNLLKYGKSVIEFGIQHCLSAASTSSELEYKFVKVWKRLHSKIPNLVWSYTLQGCSLVQLEEAQHLPNLLALDSLMSDVMMVFRLPSKIYQSRYLIQIPITMALCSLLGWKERLLYCYLTKPPQFRNGMGFDGFSATIVSEYTWLLQTLIELMNPKNYPKLPNDFDLIKIELIKACDTLLLESNNLVKSLLHQTFEIEMIPQILNYLPSAKAALKDLDFVLTLLHGLMIGSDCQKWFGICLTGHIVTLCESEHKKLICNERFIEKIKRVTNQYFNQYPLYNSTTKQYITPSQVKFALNQIIKNYPSCEVDMANFVKSLPFENSSMKVSKPSNQNQSTEFDFRFQYFNNSLKLALVTSPLTVSPNRSARPTTPPNNSYHPPSNREGGDFTNDNHHFSKRGPPINDYDSQSNSNMIPIGNHKKYKKEGPDSGFYRPSSSNYIKSSRNAGSGSGSQGGNKSPINMTSNVRPNNPHYHNQHPPTQQFREGGGGGRFPPGGSRPPHPPPNRKPGGYSGGNREQEDRFGHPNSRGKGKKFSSGGPGGGRGKSMGGGNNRRGSNVE